MTESWADEYEALVTRFDRWNWAASFGVPILIFLPSPFLGAFLFASLGWQFISGWMTGMIVGWIGSIWLVRRLLGFFQNSPLSCPSCGISVAGWAGYGYRCDHWCRRCGHKHADVGASVSAGKGEGS